MIIRRIVTVCAMLSCLGYLFVSCGGPKNIEALIEEAPASGFVPEIDEATTRGRLTRMTPPDLFVTRRFTVAPDGGSIVFSGKQVGSRSIEPYHLYRMDIGAKAVVKITSGGDSDAMDPSFTPDGEYIVYRTGTTFWKVHKDGSGAKVKVPGTGLHKDYNPSVSSIYRVTFVTWEMPEDKYLIWTVGVDGSELTQYREGNHPVWSADGKKIAFDYDGDIWTMNADGTELVQVTATDRIVELLPSFSPDGKFIVYASNEGKDGRILKNPCIWSIGANGTSKAQITELDSWDSWPVWTDRGIFFASGRGKGKHRVQRIWRVKN